MFSITYVQTHSSFPLSLVWADDCATVTARRYNLANFGRRSGANSLLQRNHFHDSCGSGGRVILKALNASFIGNTVERSGGVHVYSEQEWLEGDLGIRNMCAFRALLLRTTRTSRFPVEIKT